MFHCIIPGSQRTQKTEADASVARYQEGKGHGIGNGCAQFRRAPFPTPPAPIRFSSLFRLLSASRFFRHFCQLALRHAVGHLLHLAARMFVFATLIGQGRAHQPALFFTFCWHNRSICLYSFPDKFGAIVPETAHETDASRMQTATVRNRTQRIQGADAGAKKSPGRG